MNIKASYSFIFGRRESKTNQKLIELHIYFDNKERCYLSTKIKIERRFWDEKAQRILNSHPLSFEYNQILYDIRRKIEECEAECYRSGKPFTKECVNALFKKKIDKAEDFISFAEKFIHEKYQMKTITYQSWQKYHSSINVFKQIMEMYVDKNGCISFETILRDDFIKDLHYGTYKHYNDNAGNKFMKNLRMFATEAVKRKKIEENPFLAIKPHRVRTASRTNITETELNALEELDRSQLSDADIQSLDRFLFSCYTGLRISDNEKLLKKDISVEKRGMIIDIVTEKGQGKRVILPIDVLFSGKAGTIARKYMEKYPEIDTLFPYLSEQHINKHLKKLALLADIRQKLTFHVARHTCASLLAEKTANPYLIMSVLGHTNIKTSMIYIHNTAEGVFKNLTNTDW